MVFELALGGQQTIFHDSQHFRIQIKIYLFSFHVSIQQFINYVYMSHHHQFLCNINLAHYYNLHITSHHPPSILGIKCVSRFLFCNWPKYIRSSQVYLTSAKIIPSKIPPCLRKSLSRYAFNISTYVLRP